MPATDPPRRFLLDVMLGKLAVYLRVCGHDAAYALDRGLEADDRLLALAAAEDRALVTRDRQLATRAPDALFLTEREVEDQLRELREAGVALKVPDRPRRCGDCNGVLDRVDDANDRPDHVPDDRAPFRCRNCGQYFWRGSHWDRMAETVENL